MVRRIAVVGLLGLLTAGCAKGMSVSDAQHLCAGSIAKRVAEARGDGDDGTLEVLKDRYRQCVGETYDQSQRDAELANRAAIANIGNALQAGAAAMQASAPTHCISNCNYGTCFTTCR